MPSLGNGRGEERDDRCAMEEGGPILQREVDWIVVKLASVTQQPYARQKKKNYDGESPQHVRMSVETGRKSIIDDIDHQYQHGSHHCRNTDGEDERRVAGAISPPQGALSPMFGHP